MSLGELFNVWTLGGEEYWERGVSTSFRAQGDDRSVVQAERRPPYACEFL